MDEKSIREISSESVAVVGRKYLKENKNSYDIKCYRSVWSYPNGKYEML